MQHQRKLFYGWLAALGVACLCAVLFSSAYLALAALILFVPPWTQANVLGRLGVSPFQEAPCSVVVSNDFDTCGTVTRATINHLTPALLETLFKPSGLFADMDAWFRTSFEMKACGTKVNGLYEWLMSSLRQLGPGAPTPEGNLLTYEKIDRGPSLLHPFVLARQDSVINDEYWAITQGQAVSAYTALVTGPLTSSELALGVATDRVIRVVSRYGIDLDSKEFVDRDRIFIFGRTGGVSTRGQWKVMAAHASSDSTFIDIVIKSENSGSTSAFDPTPQSGVVLQGANNVNDFESWCINRPTRDPRKRVPFWLQTIRRTRCVDSEYRKVFERLMESNEFFRNFGDLPLAERNRQDEERSQNSWLNSFFFGKAISGNQTMALWQNLEQILTATGATVDPGLGGKLIAYRANMIGVREQLLRCDRVRDLQNNPLNFYEWLDENYRIYRARKSQGKTVTSIDWFTDNVTAANMATAFLQYYKTESLEQFRLTMEIGRQATIGMGFIYSSYEVKFPAGIRINIITNEWFDDIVSALDAESIDSSGRFLLALEMGRPGPKGGTVYPGMITTNRVQRTVGQLENLARIDTTFACVMDHVTQDLSLISETCTAVVECPANNEWVEGVKNVVPVTTGKTGAYPAAYRDLY